MHKSATKCNKTLGKWCKNKHGASKIIDMLETYHAASGHHLQSYWLFPPGRLNLGFITEGKLAAIFIKPSLGVSNWPVIYYTFPHQLGNRSFLSPLLRFKKKFPHYHHRAINKFSGAIAEEKEDFCKGSFARTSFTLF
jgi:hypothetical protein